MLLQYVVTTWGRVARYWYLLDVRIVEVGCNKKGRWVWEKNTNHTRGIDDRKRNGLNVVEVHSRSSLTATPLPFDTSCGEEFLFRREDKTRSQ